MINSVFIFLRVTEGLENRTLKALYIEYCDCEPLQGIGICLIHQCTPGTQDTCLASNRYSVFPEWFKTQVLRHATVPVIISNFSSNFSNTRKIIKMQTCIWTNILCRPIQKRYIHMPQKKYSLNYKNKQVKDS